MTNICAAIGLAQLEQADKFLEKKLQVAEWYIEALKNTDLGYHQAIGEVKHCYWMFSILVKNKKDRDKLRQQLMEESIETRPLFYPVHTMPMYSVERQKYEVAEYISGRGISLPSYPFLSKDQVRFITDRIKSYFD